MTLLDNINEYFAIIITVIAVVANFIRMESAIKTLKAADKWQEKRMGAIEAEQKENNVEFTKIEVAIKGIETSLEWIKQKLSK